MANDSEEGPIDTSEVVRKTRVLFEVDALTLMMEDDDFPFDLE